MNKEILQKIFNETYDDYMAELLDEEKFMKEISRFSDENGKLNLAQLFSFVYNGNFERSVRFMWDVFKKIYELEENTDSQVSN